MPDKEFDKKAIVIGAGIGGIGAAIRLAVSGYHVQVFEQALIPGGKISTLVKDGFRWDTGPSLFTLPAMVDELFTLAGEDPREHFQYSRLHSSCKYFWDDGTIINAWQDTTRFADEIEEQTGVEATHVHSFLEKSKRLYQLTADVFLFHSLHRIRNYLSKSFRNSMLYINELDAFTSMHLRNRRWFSNSKVVQLFDRYATYNGSDPWQTPATLNIIAHLEHNIGAFFPAKGMYSIVETLYNLALRKGVKFSFNTRVKEVMVENSRVVGIKTDQGLMAADVVVSNVDVMNFYKYLLPRIKAPSSTLKSQRSSSALIFYWAVNRTFPQLDVHNILFANDYRQEFDHLFHRKTISPDLTVYIFISSKKVMTDAPEGMENWYVMINAPENVGQDWEALAAEARQNIIGRINTVLGVDIESHIAHESMADPRTIEKNTGSWGGSLYGNSSNNPFAAFMRHPNFSRRIRNLYFTGGSVHPGGGIPLCLASARIVGDEIKKSS